MSKKIVVLEKLDSAAGEQRYRYVLWADVPAARQPFWAKAGAVSMWTGASGAENTAIATGAVAEKVDTLIVGGGQTLAQVQATLVAAATDWQTYVTGYDPWIRYGTFYDPSAGNWNAGGVA